MRRALATAAFLLVGIGTAHADDDRSSDTTVADANAAASDTTVADANAATSDSSTVAARDDGPPGNEGTEPPPPSADAGRPADKGAIGIGLIIGEPTGITAKLYLSDDMAIQAAVGSAFIGGGLQAHGDFVIHPWILQDRGSFVLPVYLGPGVRFIDYYGARGGDSHFAAGVRGVIGLLFDFKDVPLDVFVEVAGVGEYDFTKGWGAALNAGAGVRYYF
ncbi:MAG TPA: hypothetical protein VLB44_10705 [Kofleriaceae bacterium]|nr:hypothetical protein [Kofleriaceae bacterium]